ncbi:MAG: DUF433 domain-containing protein [Proteobacteria bacterium]|nr:DUF433 domain-containing protein [Pseudomonadota bacterium]NBS50128.1 DUF433 domain-containing protein [Verrucomicrobiota bacterium]NBS79531.1 DUF433 domain-containing protein [bacterium]NBV96954.1 DUF433 domain-containing protein [Verrucomicrobiota bacterium]
MKFDWSACPSVWTDPKRLSGTPAFRGTRVPVSALFSNLKSGASLDDFLSWFPGVTRNQVEEVLAFAARESSALAVG